MSAAASAGQLVEVVTHGKPSRVRPAPSPSGIDLFGTRYAVRVRLHTSAARELRLAPAVHSVWGAERLAELTQAALACTYGVESVWIEPTTAEVTQ